MTVEKLERWPKASLAVGTAHAKVEIALISCFDLGTITILYLQSQNLCWGWWPVTKVTCSCIVHGHPSWKPWVTVPSLLVPIVLGTHQLEKNCNLSLTPTCLLLFQDPFCFTVNTMMHTGSRIYKSNVKNSGKLFFTSSFIPILNAWRVDLSAFLKGNQ